ncbi:MAG: non-heme iron oxygenase ferredoxin subunit [Aggregatilineales bacterium]
MTDFITVAKTDEIKPGERDVFGIGRKWVAVFNIDGTYYAIEDVCTHDDGPLAEGDLTGCVIACPRHGATFDIRDGKVLSAPALVDVPAYEVRVQNDEIQLSTKPIKK